MAGPNVDLIIKSTAGHWNHPFAASTLAQAVLDASISHFGLQTGPGIAYTLRTENGTTLSLSETLGQLGLKDRQTLLLQATQAQDG
jgi:hypothetical protein